MHFIKLVYFSHKNLALYQILNAYWKFNYVVKWFWYPYVVNENPFYYLLTVWTQFYQILEFHLDVIDNHPLINEKAIERLTCSNCDGLFTSKEYLGMVTNILSTLTIFGHNSQAFFNTLITILNACFSWKKGLKFGFLENSNITFVATFLQNHC